MAMIEQSLKIGRYIVKRVGLSLRHQDPRLSFSSEIDKGKDPGPCGHVRGTLIYITSESGEDESASWMSGRAVGLDLTDA